MEDDQATSPSHARRGPHAAAPHAPLGRLTPSASALELARLEAEEAAEDCRALRRLVDRARGLHPHAAAVLRRARAAGPACRQAVLRERAGCGCDGGEAMAAAEAVGDALAAGGYHVDMRVSLGGGKGQACLRNLRHAYVVAKGRDGEEEWRPHEHLVVEADFASQFVIAKPTPAYEEFFRGIPREFVGTMEDLVDVVELVCTKMQRAFEDRDMVFPVWRHASSMLSKWISKRMETVELTREDEDDGYDASFKENWAFALAEANAAQPPVERAGSECGTASREGSQRGRKSLTLERAGSECGTASREGSQRGRKSLTLVPNPHGPPIMRAC